MTHTNRFISLAAFASLAIPGVASASDGESAFSIAVGAGTWALDLDNEAPGRTVGGVVLGSYERGFSDALSWRVDLSGGVYGRGVTTR